MSTSDTHAAAASGPPLTGGRFRLGDWLVDPAVDEIARDGQAIKLEPRKMLLLVTLARRAGEVVTPDQLLDAVWPGLVVTQSSIYQSVAQLRKTLGDNRSTPEYIATVPRKGYRLIAPVGAADEPAAPAMSLTVHPDAMPASVDDVPSATKQARVPMLMPPVRPARRRWLIGTSAALAAGAGAWWWWRPVGLVDGIVRIAVLPFADQSDGAIEQATADGLANDVIHRFERSDNVLVLARNSTFTFRKMMDEGERLRALRQQLNADYALMGELFRNRERVRVSIRLLAVARGRVVWTSVFVRPAERLAELPSAIASGTLKALGLADPPQAEMNPLDAYELYLLGLNAYQTQRSMEGLRKARDYFQHAIDTDPAYARAYAGLALTWLGQSLYGVGVELREVGSRAQPLIDKALAIDPNLLEGLVAQGKLYLFTNWTDAARARVFLQKAVDLYPGNAEAQFGLAVSYAYDEQPKEAIKRYAIALELDPLNYLIHSRWGQDATFSGDFEAVRVHFARAGVLMPKDPWRFLGPGQADYARGHLDDAVANYRLQFEQDPRRPEAWGELGWFYLDLRLPTQARLAFDKKTELMGRNPYAAIEQAYVAIVEGKPTTLQSEPETDRAKDPHSQLDWMVVQAIAGTIASSRDLDALQDAMHTDPQPWVGSYWVFFGRLAWIDFAMLYDLAGSAGAGAPLLDQAQAMLARLNARGNTFHTIPFLEARIAALRGQRDMAVTRLGAAVDSGWKRTWILPFDPAFRHIKNDPRIASLDARVKKDTDVQRTHVG
jgi:DNA-binding winged helix-turn-helix (wHTH) protein/TolB-like protein/Flp pilus assembly protein TadD